MNRALHTPLAITASSLPADNLVLAALPEADYRALRPQMEFVPLLCGQVLYQPSDVVTHVFFPTSGIVSLLTPLANGTSTGIALIGNEGVVGVSVILEGLRARSSCRRAVVLSAGYAYRMRANRLLKEFERGGELQHLLLRATQAQIAQIAQTVVCNRCHKLSERLCRWLLHSLDRLCGDEIYVTQSILSELLGVRREGVTEVARELQSAGIIEYRRGHIHVSDRPALEQRVCECYATISREYTRLAPAPAPKARRVGRSPYRQFPGTWQPACPSEVLKQVRESGSRAVCEVTSGDEAAVARQLRVVAGLAPGAGDRPRKAYASYPALSC